MKKVYVFLAKGFEETEAIFTVDILRRAGIDARLVGVNGMQVTGGHGIQVTADLDGEGFVLPQDADMVFLPGGGEGTANLLASKLVGDVLREAARRGIYIAAICAAPTVLRHYGLLEGKRATAFPDNQPQLTGAQVTGAAVEVDGNIITGRSAGVAMQFGQVLAGLLVGEDKAKEVVNHLYPEKG